MSKNTLYRRRRAAGLTKPIVPASFNHEFFDSWSDEMAWMLGLIWSDGCLFGNTVEISSKDFQLIDLAMAVIGGGSYRLKNNGQHVRMYFTSPHTAARLRAIGLTEHKSLTIQWPNVSPDYEGAFMRGLIDGDGSVLSYQYRSGQQVPDLHVQLVTASPFLRDGIAAWFDREEMRFSLSGRDYPERPNWHTLWKFSVNHQTSLKKLHGLLYPEECVPCLHRKRIPFDDWMTTPRARSGRRKVQADQI